MIVIAAIVLVATILEAAGLKRRNPGKFWMGSGLLVLFSIVGLIQLSNEHNWPYHPKHALHQFALIPMIVAGALIVTGMVRAARSEG